MFLNFYHRPLFGVNNERLFQTYVSGSPYYQGSKYYQGTHGAQYYQGGLGGQYYQDGAYYQGAPAHFVQPSSMYHTRRVVQSGHDVKTVAPAPATVGVHHEYERFAAPAVVRAHAAPVVKTVVPAPATVGVHHERFAAPATAHIVKAAHPVPHQAAVEPYHVIVKQANDDNFDGSFAYRYSNWDLAVKFGMKVLRLSVE